LNSNESNTRLLLDSVQLYKALGGGWQVFEQPSNPTASAKADRPPLS
jgi:multidrug efflux system outer membrane protein